MKFVLTIECAIFVNGIDDISSFNICWCALAYANHPDDDNERSLFSIRISREIEKIEAIERTRFDRDLPIYFVASFSDLNIIFIVALLEMIIKKSRRKSI